MESKKHDLSRPRSAVRHSAAYAREATAQPGRSALKAQVEACVRQAAEDGAPPVGAAYTFRDRQSGLELDRPGLTQLRRAVQAGEVGLVYVYSLDRLSRDPKHLMLLYEEFASAGVEIRFVQGSFDIDLRGLLLGLVASGV